MEVFDFTPIRSHLCALFQPAGRFFWQIGSEHSERFCAGSTHALRWASDGGGIHRPTASLVRKYTTF